MRARQFGSWEEAIAYCDNLRTIARVHALQRQRLFSLNYSGEDHVEVELTPGMQGAVMQYSVDERTRMKV